MSHDALSKGCMYKVHEQLRDVNENAYKPVLLAIGPYYDQGKVGHGFMNEHKLRYQQQMLRTKGSKERYMEVLWELEESARKCYVDCISQTQKEFVEMMLLDGCFIIELFRKYEKYKETRDGDHDPIISTDEKSLEYGVQDPTGECNPIISSDEQSPKYEALDPTDEDDPIFQMKWVLLRIARDLLLFENQLPFFVLAKLFEMSEGSKAQTHKRPKNSAELIVNIEEKDRIGVESSTSTDQIILTRSLIDLALGFFSDFLPFKWNVDASSYNSTEKIEELLCLRYDKRLTPSLPVMVLKRLGVGFRLRDAKFEHLLGLIHATISISIIDTEIGHAKEHQEAGVKFQKVEIFNHLCGLIRKLNIWPLPTKRIRKSSCAPQFQTKNFEVYMGKNWKSIPCGLELQNAGVELNMAKKFNDNLDQIRRWMTIPYAIEFQEAGIEFDKAKKLAKRFKDLQGPNRNDNKELCLKKELHQAGVKSKKAKKFMRLHALREIEHWSIHGATELEEAGIEFKKAEKCNSTFSIKFNKGRMEISPLSIEDHTETYLRNLIAYEQYCDGDNGFDFDYVANYVSFMDYLINSPKDVELLRRKGIIRNFLGDDEVTSTMVNKLGHYITFSNSSSMYARTSMEVNMHCNKRRNVWMAKLKRDYFNSPWALISFLAAVLLLALAIVQTIFSIIP